MRWSTEQIETATRMRRGGAKHGDIAARLGVSSNAVRLRLRRAAPRLSARNGQVNTPPAPAVHKRMTTTPTRHPATQSNHLTAERVQLALSVLLGDGRLSLSDVQRAVARGREIARIKAELARLRGSIEPAPARKPFHMTPAMVRCRRIQGRYLGALKRFPQGPVRAEARAIAHSKGVAAALAFLNKQSA